MVSTTCLSCGQAHSGDSLFCQWCAQYLNGPDGLKAASVGKRLVAVILDSILWILTLVIGYIIWALIVYSKGQTPGKQIVGIRSVRLDGTEAGWGLTFVREFLVKGLLLWLLSAATGFIVIVVDYIWALFDKDNQTIHDKLVGTLVVTGTQKAR